MTASFAGTLAVALALDEPEDLLAYLKQQAMAHIEVIDSVDKHLANKWCLVADEIAAIELKLADLKRPTLM
jgi:hypothetical protein